MHATVDFNFISVVNRESVTSDMETKRKKKGKLSEVYSQ